MIKTAEEAYAAGYNSVMEKIALLPGLAAGTALKKVLAPERNAMAQTS